MNISIKGCRYRGIIEANNLESLIDILEDLGILIIDIEKYGPFDDLPITIKSNIEVTALSQKDFDLLVRVDQANYIMQRSAQTMPVIHQSEKYDVNYLPFKTSQLIKYFTNPKHLNYFKKSSDNYHEWKELKNKKYNSSHKRLRQIEKDEKFWVSKSFITIFEQVDKHKITSNLKEILIKAFGDKPPFKYDSWNSLIDTKNQDNLILKFEENIPSPKSYKEYLSENYKNHHFIKYILEKAINKNREIRKDLEGPTNVDALIINPSNGFNIFIEAKVLSDISYDVTNDIFRNQIARNVDVMTSKHEYSKSGDFRTKINPNKSLFLLVTPRHFLNNPHSRLYGYKMEEYKKDPLAIKNDLPHRKDINDEEWKNISNRISWLSWNDLYNVNPLIGKFIR